MFYNAQHHCQCHIQSSRTVMQNETSVSTTRGKRIYQISEYHLLKVRLHKMHILQLMMSWTHHKLWASLKCPRLSAWRRSVTNESKSTKTFRRRVVVLCFLDFAQRWGKCQGIAKNEDSPLPPITEVFSWSNSSAPRPPFPQMGRLAAKVITAFWVQSSDIYPNKVFFPSVNVPTVTPLARRNRFQCEKHQSFQLRQSTTS
jgi:hypothetical protein